MCACVYIYVCARACVCEAPRKAKAPVECPHSLLGPGSSPGSPRLSASPVLVVGVFLVEALILGLHVAQASVVIRVNKGQVNLVGAGGRPPGAAVDQASSSATLYTPSCTQGGTCPELGSPVPTSHLLPQLIQLQLEPPASPPVAFPTTAPQDQTPLLPTAFCPPSNTALGHGHRGNPLNPAPQLPPALSLHLQSPPPSSLGPGAQHHPLGLHGLWVL